MTRKDFMQAYLSTPQGVKKAVMKMMAEAEEKPKKTGGGGVTYTDSQRR